MNAMTPVSVLFHDLLGELAAIAQAVELAHGHAPSGTTLAGGAQALDKPFDGAFQFLFHQTSLLQL